MNNKISLFIIVVMAGVIGYLILLLNNPRIQPTNPKAQLSEEGKKGDVKKERDEFKISGNPDADTRGEIFESEGEIIGVDVEKKSVTLAMNPTGRKDEKTVGKRMFDLSKSAIHKLTPLDTTVSPDPFSVEDVDIASLKVGEKLIVVYDEKKFQNDPVPALSATLSEGRSAMPVM